MTFSYRGDFVRFYDSLKTDWLQNKQMPLDQFRDSAIEVLREAWNMRG